MRRSGVEVDGKRLERAYSMCSSPYEEELEFFVERVHGGELSPLLHAMEKGAPLLLRRFAKGRFTLDLRSGRKNHLLLATVTGVAPYVSYAANGVCGLEKRRDVRCRGSTGFSACRGQAVQGNLVIARNWKNMPQKPRGSNTCRPLAGPGRDRDWKGERGRVG